MKTVLAAAVLAAGFAAPATAAFPAMLSISAGPLRTAIVTLGTQAGVTIGLSDPALGPLPVRALSGRMPVAAALDRLLAGTPATYRRIDPATFRIVPRSGRPRAPRAASPPPPAATGAIVVTGSKRNTAIGLYDGSVHELAVGDLSAGSLGRGSEALVEAVPVLTSTHLGPGRNKLFIRGLADSSFNGPSQSIVGEYLGEVRLNYSAPDPSLALYDVRSVEVLEGPQGTLYGAGTLGGIVRLVPQPPALDRYAGWLSAGVSATWAGAPGGDGAAMLNLPILRDRLGLRAVGYVRQDGGYIDDPLRDAHDINGTLTRGGRLTVRWAPPGWTVDVGAVLQDINSADGQYAERDLPPLQRRSVIAQPFDNDYALGSVTVRHAIGGAELVSASAAVHHDIRSVFDASLDASTPIRFIDDNGILLLSNETRLSEHNANGSSWVVGAAFLHNRSRIHRALGTPGAEAAIAGTSNAIDDGALFGEATVKLRPRLFGTAGGRVALNHLSGHVIGQPDDDPADRRHELSVLPSLGLLWAVTPRLSAYARYQQGYRPGGLAVSAGASQRYEADSVATWEAGLRAGSAGDRLSASLALSHAHWEDIQADLVDGAGLPYTANIGSGRVTSLEFNGQWRPSPRGGASLALFLTRSRLTDPAAAFAGEHDATLPNIPAAVVRLGGDYRISLLGRPVRFTASARYVGRSRLGVGPSLDLKQGRYLDTEAGLSVRLGRVTVSLDATNLADARRNIFALGDPFGVASGDQVTPLRPRTVRVGTTVPF